VTVARYTYKPDRIGMDPWFVSVEARILCRRAAESAVTFARSIAPVGQPPDDQHPGRYRDSIHIDPRVYLVPKRGRFSARVAVRVVADARGDGDTSYAAVLEVQRGHHTLKRAAEHINDPKPRRRV
jgi:hypothetical protein